MALKSVYLPEPVVDNNLLHISDEEHRHLTVARAQTGELLDVFDGKGRVWTAAVVEVGKRHTTVRVESERSIAPPTVELVLGQALIKTAALELALEKAVEVGVTRIIPFMAARSNAPSVQKPGRWHRIIVEAAKQSKRFYLPLLDEPVRFASVLSVPASSRIMFSEQGGGSLKTALSGSPVLYLIGPEGGWTETELETARGAGFQCVTLGSGILRAETAAIVGAALIQYEMGE
jgi:16S rRNA (uracil1498-N3)-methyltransferase